MKIIIILLILFFSDKTEKVLSPPGTTHLKENIYIDKEIVSNLSWKEYLYAYESQGMLEKSFYPDTTIVVDGVNYFKDEKFEDYAVLGLTYEMMEHFCRWRSAAVSHYLKTWTKKSKCKSPYYVNNSKYNIKVTYRLPTREELDYAIEKGIIKKTKYHEITQETVNFEGLDKSKIAFRCVAEVIELD